MFVVKQVDLQFIAIASMVLEGYSIEKTFSTHYLLCMYMHVFHLYKSDHLNKILAYIGSYSYTDISTIANKASYMQQHSLICYISVCS